MAKWVCPVCGYVHEQSYEAGTAYAAPDGREPEGSR